MIKLCRYLLICSIILSYLFTSLVSASDVSVWQGQYYTGTTFNIGTYNFSFTIYDDLTGGNICYSNTTTLTTGNFGDWQIEQRGVNSLCDNVSKNYFLNININGVDQTPRRRLVVWDYLRKNVDEITTGNVDFATNTTISSDFINVRTRMRELNKDIWKLKILYAAETANVTLVSQGNLAKAQIVKDFVNSNKSVGESLEFKKGRLINEAELAKTLLNSNLMIAEAKINEAKELAKLNGEKPEDMVFLEEEAAAKKAKLNATSSILSNQLDIILNNSINALVDDGTRALLISPEGNLKKEGEVGNISVTGTGFFIYLGSLINRVTKLFVQDINFNGNINGTGNITTTGKISTTDVIQGNYYSNDSSAGITNTNSYWVCIDPKCKNTCQLQIKNGLITGCV